MAEREPTSAPHRLDQKQRGDVYSTLRRELELRIVLQNKCVELSVLVTSGASVAALAAMLRGDLTANAAAAIADVAAIWLATTGQIGGAQVIGSVGAGFTSACGAYFVF